MLCNRMMINSVFLDFPHGGTPGLHNVFIVMQLTVSRGAGVTHCGGRFPGSMSGTFRAFVVRCGVTLYFPWPAHGDVLL